MMRFHEYDDSLTPEKNTACAMIEIASAIHRVADALAGVGLGGTQPGALEFIGMALHDGLRVDLGTVDLGTVDVRVEAD